MTSEPIDYAAWGELFFPTAVTLDRVLAAVNSLAGRPVEVGPLGVGPGRLAKATATGRIGTATGNRVAQQPVTFTVTLPVDLDLELDLGVDRQHFRADITIPLIVSAHARSDLSIFIEVEPPSADLVSIELKARGLRAGLTQRAAGVDRELQTYIAKYVKREINQPHVMAAREIDVSGTIAKAVDRGVEQD